MKRYNLMFFLLTAVFAAAFCALMFNNNVWYDEAYTLAMIEHGFKDIAKITAADVHPPLYYWMLKLFMLPFGKSLIAAKVFSIIPILLTMLLGYVKIGSAADKKTGLLFALFFGAMPVFTMYSVQVRMYSWCGFFVFGCGVWAYFANRDNKLFHWILFWLFGVAAAYTHYFALVSAGVIYAMLLVASIKKKRFGKWLVFSLLTVMAYSPWLMSFISQLADKVENEYWIAPITLETVGGYFKTWYKCGDDMWRIYLIGSAAVYTVAAAGLLFTKKKGIKTGVLLGVLVFVLTNLTGIAASLAVRPVYIERYAIGALPFLALFAAAGIGCIDKKGISLVTVLFYLAGFGVNYPYDYRFEYGETDAQTGEYINNGGFDALICCVDSQLYGVLAYYAPKLNVYRPKTSQGSPFDNIHELSELDVSSCHRAALFIPDGAEVPQEIIKDFNSAQYDCDVVTYGQKSNVFVLER